jgi:hypothetical protein
MADASVIRVIIRKMENILYGPGHPRLKLFRLKMALSNKGMR